MEADLKPSDGGCFEVVVDGDLVFSKLKEDRFPEEGEVVASMKTKTDELPSADGNC